MENYMKNYGQEGFVRRPYSNRKPPLGIWKPAIPTWEKKFCKAVGSLNWNAFLEKKKYIDMYDNILEWNDSAGEEAFHSAKKRFFAELNRIPCDEDMPDPDLYIDEIDWDCQIDEELLSVLECRSITISDEKSDPVIIFGDDFIRSMPFFSTGWGTGWGEMPKATGWGDEDKPKATGWGDEDIPKATGWADEEDMPKATGWGDEEDILKNHGNQWTRGWGDDEDIPKVHDNQWECSYEKTTGREKENKAEDCPNNTWHLNKGDGWSSGWTNSQGMKGEADFNNPKNRNCGYDGSCRRWDNSDAIRTRAGMSRNKGPRIHGEGHNSNSSWKGRNLQNNSWRQKNTGRTQPKGRWNSNAGRPSTHQASDNARQIWN